MNETQLPDYPLQIYRVKSRSTRRVYCLASPCADTDAVTNGLLLLASKAQPEIHLLYADDDEYDLGPYEGAVRRAERENVAQERDDLVGVGIDLDKKSKLWNRMICRFAFHDIFADGHADAIEPIPLKTYIDEGGKIIDRRAEFVG